MICMKAVPPSGIKLFFKFNMFDTPGAAPRRRNSPCGAGPRGRMGPPQNPGSSKTSVCRTAPSLPPQHPRASPVLAPWIRVVHSSRPPVPSEPRRRRPGGGAAQSACARTAAPARRPAPRIRRRHAPSLEDWMPPPRGKKPRAAPETKSAPRTHAPAPGGWRAPAHSGLPEARPGPFSRGVPALGGSRESRGPPAGLPGAREAGPRRPFSRTAGSACRRARAAGACTRTAAAREPAPR